MSVAKSARDGADAFYRLVVLDLRAPSVLLGFQLGGTNGHRFLSRYTVSLDLKQSVMELQEFQP